MHWIGIIISFPRKQEGDFTLKKYEQSLTSEKMFGDRAATWEVHPRFEKGHPMYQPASDRWVVIDDLNVRVPKELEDDFKHDGVDAMTKYMAQPPLTEGGFFENPQTITEAQNPNLPPIITTVSEREEQLEGGTIRRYVRHELEQLPEKHEDVQYFMHGDPGLSNDAFALALCHTTPEQKQVTDQKGDPVYIQKVVVDFVLTWEPKPRKPVDLLNVDETIMFLAKHYNVRRVTFDRWNSAQSIQKLISFGIDAEDMNFTMTQQYAMYRYLRLCFYNAMIELPVDEKLQNELKFIKEKNQHITHDIYGKDRADAVAAVVNGFCNDLDCGRPEKSHKGPLRRASPRVTTSVIRSWTSTAGLGIASRGPGPAPPSKATPLSFRQCA